jgi:hypothetical protein
MVDFTKLGSKPPPDEEQAVSIITFDYHKLISQVKKVTDTYKASLEQYKKMALDMEVKDEKAALLIVELGTRAAKLVKQLNGDKKTRIEPYNGYVRDCHAVYKPLTELGKDIKEICGDKHARYQAWVEVEVKKKMKAAEDAAKLEQAKLDAEAKEAGVESEVVAPPVVEPRSRTTRVDSGAGHVRKHWTWKCVDFDKVPKEFEGVPLIILNEPQLNKLVKGGLRGDAIPGIEIYQTTKTQFRTK